MSGCIDIHAHVVPEKFPAAAVLAAIRAGNARRFLGL
jgi:hypothetical protein